MVQKDKAVIPISPELKIIKYSIAVSFCYETSGKAVFFVTNSSILIWLFVRPWSWSRDSDSLAVKPKMNSPGD